MVLLVSLIITLKTAYLSSLHRIISGAAIVAKVAAAIAPMDSEKSHEDPAQIWTDLYDMLMHE